MDPVYVTLGVGIFGGAVIEIYRVYKIMQKGGTFIYSKGMLIMSILMALIAGGLAVLFHFTEPLSPFTAFWIGISTPTILDKLLGTSPVTLPPNPVNITGGTG